MAIKATVNQFIQQELITGTLDELNALANSRLANGYELITATMVRLDSFNGVLTMFYVWAKNPNLK